MSIQQFIQLTLEPHYSLITLRFILLFFVLKSLPLLLLLGLNSAVFDTTNKPPYQNFELSLTHVQT